MNKVKDFLDKSIDLNHVTIDIDTLKAQKTITTLPNDFTIKSVDDIQKLKEYFAVNYTKAIRLFRGHESKTYKIESTIYRALTDKKLSIYDVVLAEKKAFNLFRNVIFKPEWLQNKPTNVSTDLFIMSIGRHLGLPCRLLDVTASIETAIWFAVMNPKFYNKDGELVVIILNKDVVKNCADSPFDTDSVCYAHEPFMVDNLNDLPLGEQRRFIQNGHFIWVGNDFLLNEQSEINNSAYAILRFEIPFSAKVTLASDLFLDVYSGCAYHAEIDRIKREIQVK